jgi:CRISPR-associated protein (TIGR02584 family)
MNKRIILIAGMGTSPAVLTETVWALAHQKKPVVPDEIVVLVTMSGKDKLCKELLSGDKPVWDEMLTALKKDKIKVDGKLLFGDTSIHVISDEKGNGARNYGWSLSRAEP